MRDIQRKLGLSFQWSCTEPCLVLSAVRDNSEGPSARDAHLDGCSQLLKTSAFTVETGENLSPIGPINCLVTLENMAPDLRHTETLLSGRTCQGLRAQFTVAGQVLKEQSFLGIAGYGQPRPAMLVFYCLGVYY